MQQKIITLGVRESHSSFHSPDSPTPNHPQNIPTISPKKNKANIPLVLKNEPTNSSSSNNANISNFLSEENLNNIESNSPINCNLSNDLNSNNQYNTGRWTEEEHNKFIEGILEYGNEWKKVQQIIKTRSSTQARSPYTDTDIAEEATNLTKNQIMQQINVSVLANANTSQQLALSLLG